MEEGDGGMILRRDTLVNVRVRDLLSLMDWSFDQGKQDCYRESFHVWKLDKLKQMVKK